MSDSYQAIYDAVRSRISNGDIGQAVSDAIRDANIGHYVASAPKQAQETSLPPQGAASPDPQLLKFYVVSDYPSLVAAMLRHIEKLQSKLPKDGQPLLTRVRA